jgi:lysophospholipid acyltransferase (LPLAT)-like uncharacterized protein
MRPATRLLCRVLGRVYRLYYRTLRLRALLPDGSIIHPAAFPFARQIFVLSERDSIALAGITADMGFVVLVAHGRDGDWASAALEAIGCQVVRGSTRRGGARALATLLSRLDVDARPAGLVVDGPLGPVGVAQPGAALCAIRTARPIHVLSGAASRAVVVHRAWSRIYVPLPFSRVVLFCDGPLSIPTTPDRQAVDLLTANITERLGEGQRRAQQLLRHPSRFRAAAAPAGGHGSARV